jgi:excisionase family DNA binding protein
MGNKEIEQKWLNTQQAADYLGISKSTLYHWVNDRKIEFHKLSIAGRLRFLKEDLDDHMVHCSELSRGRPKWRA